MSFSSIKTLFLIGLVALVSSCGSNKDQEVKDAILSANILLSTSQCQPAIDLLESMGRQNKNAYYLKSLASAYACRAGYSAVTLFGTDIEKTASPSPLGGMTTYSTSTVTATSPLTDDLKYRDLQTAIDILMYAGGIPVTSEPTTALRANYFSANDAGDINAQMAFMILVQTGKFMKVYGNVNAAGAKGLGSGTNHCFSDYNSITDTYVTAALSAQAGSCKVKNSPHPQLDSSLLTVAERRKRLCEGVVLMNSLLDLLPNIIATAGGTKFGNTAASIDDINDARDFIVTNYPSIGAVATVVSQNNCETSASITNVTIESYYASVFEGLIN